MKSIVFLFLIMLPKLDALCLEQEKTIEGQIVTANEEPISFQKIKCSPTKAIHCTDENRKFKFKTHLGEQLIIKRKGFKTRKIVVSTNNNYYIILSEKDKNEEILIFE